MHIYMSKAFVIDDNSAKTLESYCENLGHEDLYEGERICCSESSAQLLSRGQYQTKYNGY